MGPGHTCQSDLGAEVIGQDGRGPCKQVDTWEYIVSYTKEFCLSLLPALGPACLVDSLVLLLHRFPP